MTVFVGAAVLVGTAGIVAVGEIMGSDVGVGMVGWIVSVKAGVGGNADIDIDVDVDVDVDVGVGVSVSTGVGVNVNVGLGVRVNVDVGVGVNVGRRVCVSVERSVDVDVGADVNVGVSVGVNVDVNINVGGGDGVRVDVGDMVGVNVGVATSIDVGRETGVMNAVNGRFGTISLGRHTVNERHKINTHAKLLHFPYNRIAMGFSALSNVSSTAIMWWSGVGLFVCAIAWVASGLFDPKLYPSNTMDERTFTVSAEPRIEWQNNTLTTPFSHRVTFQLPTEPEVAVGVAFGAFGDAFEDEKRPFIISATNSGFVQIVHGDEVILPEQTWPLASLDPYVQGGEAAEFRVDVSDMNEDGVTIWINREILWRGVVDGVWEQWGMFGDGFGREIAILVSAP